MNRIKWLGHEIDENGIKLNEEKIEAIQKLKPHSYGANQNRGETPRRKTKITEEEKFG